MEPQEETKGIKDPAHKAHTVAAFVILALTAVAIGAGAWYYLSTQATDSYQSILKFKKNGKKAETTVTSTTPTTTQNSQYKTFVSKGGWTLEYPSSWTYASCTMCPDPTAAGMYVSFSSGVNALTDGFVQFSPLKDKPSNYSNSQWLAELGKTLVANQHVSEESMTLAGLTAYKVVAVDSKGAQSEYVYLLNGIKTYSISMTGTKANTKVENYVNYVSYSHMKESLKFN